LNFTLTLFQIIARSEISTAENTEKAANNGSKVFLVLTVLFGFLY
jgi:hypothetical protein